MFLSKISTKNMRNYKCSKWVKYNKHYQNKRKQSKMPKERSYKFKSKNQNNKERLNSFKDRETR